MKLSKAPKKDYFIATPEIAHFSKLHTGIEEDDLMSSIKVGILICENKKAQNQFLFALKLVIRPILPTRPR